MRTTFHLTVDWNGIVSLWDTEEAARRVRNETYIALPLTAPQITRLIEAMDKAKKKTNLLLRLDAIVASGEADDETINLLRELRAVVVEEAK